MPLIEDCGGKGDWSRRGKEREEKEREERYPAVQLAGARGADTEDTGMVVDRDDRLPEEANKLNLLAEIYRNAGYRTWAQIAAEERANASNASSANGLQPPTSFQTLTQKEREEKYPAVQPAGARGADTDDTGMVVDRDDRLPEEANKLNLLAEIYRNAGYRTWAQIAAEEQANASNASSANGLQPPTPFQTHTHSVVNPSAGNQTSDQRP
ncbi:hypothetical protein V8E54_005853 [Elaphomyces granulatus]